MSKGFVYRFLIYGVIVLYLLLDLKVVQGPLHQWVMAKQGATVEELRGAGIAATVYQQPILISQVEYRLASYLYRRGRSQEDMSEQEYRLVFQHCLEELILEHFVRAKTYHNEMELPPIPEEEISEEYANDIQQFSSIAERLEAEQSVGMLEGELRLRSHAYLQQQQYLARQISTTAREEEITPQQVTLPERWRVRHIFRSTWDRDVDLVKDEFQADLQPLIRGEISFEALSDRINEDARAKSNAGEIGWMSSYRLPEGIDLTAIKEPSLLQSKLGWHWIEVLDYRQAEMVALPRDSVLAMLENEKREKGLDYYLRHLRYREDKNVVIVWSEYQ